MNAWQLAQQLVRIDSSNPEAQEDTIERYIKLLVEQRVSSMPACLVKHISIKELEVFPARRNLNVTVAGYGSAPNLVYICHMDTVTFDMVQGGYQPYVVPDACTTWIDMRLVPPATTAKAETIVQDAIERTQQEVAGIQGTYRITGDRPPPSSATPALPCWRPLSKRSSEPRGRPRR